MDHRWSQPTGPLDDAALLEVAPGVKLAYTLDVITPIVDDGRVFGRIAAANALSDVYAMGGTPQVALSFAGLPSSFGLELFREVLHGAAEKCVEAGCAVVGGHTIKDTEPKCGLAVIGSVEGEPWTHRDAREGDALVLTKKIGTGIIGQSIKTEQCEDAWLDGAVASMSQLNDVAMKAGRAAGAHAATDVTGFGLLGHLHHMAQASGLTARIDAGSVPLLDGVREAAERGLIPGGTKNNLKYVVAHLDPGACSEREQLILADAQTSGGLLLALPKGRALDLDDAWVIGELTAPSGKTLELI